MAQGLKDILANATAAMCEVSATAAAEEHVGERRALFLDVREAAELAGGKIPGALHVPRGLLEMKAAADSPARESLFEDSSQSIIVSFQSGVRARLPRRPCRNSDSRRCARWRAASLRRPRGAQA